MYYPIEKYKFYMTGDGRTIKAVSTFAGKTVFGKATCSPNDTFDLEKGKELAAARCNAKVCALRKKRAEREIKKAVEQYNKAMKNLKNMDSYVVDATNEYFEAVEKVGALIDEM